MANIQKRAKGVWRARYRDTAGREHARHFTRKVDAQQWVNQVTAAIVSRQYVDPRAGRVSFEDYFAEWSARQVWTTNTQKAMSLAVRSAPFSALQLREIKVCHVEAWVKSMSTRLEPSTIRTRFTNVRSVFRAALRDRLIPHDPTAGVRLPRQREREAQMRIPTPQEVRALLDAADDRFRVFLALLAFAGLRLGEAAALQSTDINFLRRTIGVHRQVQRAGGGQVEIRLPKHGSERDVYAPDELLQMLAALVESGVREPWLFSVGGKSPPHQNTVGHRWRQTCTRADISGVALHELRHFYASGLIASGCDLVTVQRAMGHAKPSTTLNSYSWLWPTAEDRTPKAAAAMMREATGSEFLADSMRTGQRR